MAASKWAGTRVRQFASLAVLLIALCFLPTAFSQAQDSVTAQQVEAGRQLYAGSCGNSYCHGSEGKGGGAPILRDRVFRVGYLRSVISDGSDGTPMPGFKGRMTAQEINQVVAYLLSLSPGKGDKPEQVFAAKAAPATGTQTNDAANAHFNQTQDKPKTETANQPPQVNLSVTSNGTTIRGDVQAGRAVFFDQSNANNCSACHSVNGVGGKVASDLSRLRELPPRQLALRILTPQNSEPERYGLLQVTTRGGEKIVGIKRDEDAETVRLYDTSTRPPISRSFLKTEIASAEKLLTPPCPASGSNANGVKSESYAEKFTVKHLLDLITFLKSADLKTPASVTLKDLF